MASGNLYYGPESRRSFQRRSLGLALLAMVLVFVMWNVEAFDIVLYPFRLFVTYVHEAGHSLMALLTGGEIIGFTVRADGSGLATTAGGTRALILPAGYLGAALFGGLLFYLTNRLQRTRVLSVGLGLLLMGFSLMFARPEQSGLPVALLIGIGFGGVLMFMGWRLSQNINLLVLNMLALLTGLNAVMDLLYLVRSVDTTAMGTAGPIRNDAAAFSAEVAPLVPPVVWAVMWAIAAVLILGMSLYYAILRPMLSRLL